MLGSLLGLWAEGGTLTQSGGSQNALLLSMMLIAQAIFNRLAVANGQVAVVGVDGNIYWGRGGVFNGVATLNVSPLGFGTFRTSMSTELWRAASGAEIGGIP